jgi:hypothetical protein
VLRHSPPAAAAAAVCRAAGWRKSSATRRSGATSRSSRRAAARQRRLPRCGWCVGVGGSTSSRLPVCCTSCAPWLHANGAHANAAPGACPKRAAAALRCPDLTTAAAGRGLGGVLAGGRQVGVVAGPERRDEDVAPPLVCAEAGLPLSLPQPRRVRCVRACVRACSPVQKVVAVVSPWWRALCVCHPEQSASPPG